MPDVDAPRTNNMSGETTEITESLSIDGPIGIGPSMAIGLALALAFAWLLWSQRRAIGLRWAAIFWGMRVLAMAIVLWMLLGPNWVTQRKTTQPQAVAILVDTSDSMDVSDPATGVRQIRWQQAASGPASDASPLASCDRAAVSVRMAIRRIQQARESVLRHQPSRKIRGQFESVATAVDRGISHLERELSGLSGGDADIRSKTERVLSLLQGNIAQDLRELTESLERATVPPAGELSESLLTVEDSLESVERRVSELMRNLEQSDGDNGSSHASDSSAGLSRRDHVARALEAMQESATEQSEQPVSIRPFRFDRQAAVASLANGWETVLQSSPAGSVSAGTGNEESTQEPAMTDISSALDQLGRTAAADSIRSAILISDGAHNAADSPPPQEIAATLGDIPVHVVPIGHSRVLRDALLHRVDAPTAVVQNDSILIDVIVTAFECAGDSANLILRKDGKQIDEQTVSFNKDRTDRRTFFQVAAEELGTHEFELALEPLEDESNTTNNIAQLTVNVVQDTLRVLLVDRIARWEYRYLEQLFRRDESITFDKLLFYPKVSASGQIAEIGELPTDVQGWSHYNVVILGDLEAKQLNSRAQASLDEFVRVRGGHLIVVAGRENMPGDYEQQPLMELLPVEKTRQLSAQQGLQIALTAAGRVHPAMSISETETQSERVWNQQFQYLPLYSLSDYSRPRPTAESLIAVDSPQQSISAESELNRSPNHALLCWHQVGAGRVVYLSSPATYRLRYRRGDRYHHLFWGQMLRWLTATERAAGTQTVRINTDSIRYEAGDPVDVNVRLFDKDGNPVPSATIGAMATPKSGSAVSVDLIADDKIPGRYFGSFTGLSADAYRIVPTGTIVDQLLPLAEEKDLAEARVTVAAAGSPEQTNTRCNVTLLRQIAEVTGGQIVPPTAIDEILMLSSLTQEVSERVERRPLWTRWSLLLIPFGCLCAEWIIRKRLGLV